MLEVEFDEVTELGHSYAHGCGKQRDLEHQFVGRTSLLYRKGQEHPEDFREQMTARLGREPTGWEKTRPFLGFLHSLIPEEDFDPDDRPHYSKIVSALEEIEYNFEHSATPPTLDAVISFIKECHGVTGLYDRRRKRAMEDNDERDEEKEDETDTARVFIPPEKATPARTGRKSRPQAGGKPRTPQPHVAAGANQDPGHAAPESQDPQDGQIVIHIANLGASVIKDREGTRLKVPVFGPGKHIIHMEVSQDGFVEDWEKHIVGEDEDAVQLQPPVCPIGSGEASARH